MSHRQGRLGWGFAAGATVRPGAGGTPHARFGDAFAWLSGGVMAWLMALALAPSRRARSGA